MKRVIKVIKVTEDTCVACAVYDGVGLGSMILNTTGMSKTEIEREFLQRFNSQMTQKRNGVKVKEKIRHKYDIEWYRFDEITKGKPSYMKEVLEPEEERWIVDVDEHGKPIPRKIGKTFNEVGMRAEVLRVILEGK